MAMTIVENHLLSVTGGIDTHRDFHVAAAVDPNGGLLGVETFDTTTGGYRRLVAWLAAFGDIDLIGVEGTGSYGAGIARHLAGKGIRVVEVDRPNRQARHRAGKTDAVDAIAAARAALSGTGTGVPKTRTGPIEAIRVLTVARRSAASEWTTILNQMRHICFTAPDELRTRFQDLTPITLVKTCAALKPRRSDADIVRFTCQTATETGTAGFNLLAETPDGAIRLNSTLIASPVIDSVTPTGYSYVAVTDAERFFMQEVGIDGDVDELGPFALGEAYGAQVETPSIAHPADNRLKLYLPAMRR